MNPILLSNSEDDFAFRVVVFACDVSITLFRRLLLLVKLPVTFLDLFEGEITRRDAQRTRHHGPYVGREQLGVGDFGRVRLINRQIFQLDLLVQLRHRQPDHRLGAVGLLPCPEM